MAIKLSKVKAEIMHGATLNEASVKDEKLVSETLAHETDEFEMLMSLALDGELTPAQAQRFEDWLAQPDEQDELALDSGAQYAAEWMLWQELDAQLKAAPHEAPPLNFAAGVMQRVAVQERRRRLWLGGIIGVAAVLLWCTGVLGVLGLAALISANQTFWLGEFVQSLAYWWSAVAGFFVSALRAAGTLLATAQARAIVLVYCTLATGLLGLWWVWLRRTTQATDETSAI